MTPKTITRRRPPTNDEVNRRLERGSPMPLEWIEEEVEVAVVPAKYPQEQMKLFRLCTSCGSGLSTVLESGMCQDCEDRLK